MDFKIVYRSYNKVSEAVFSSQKSLYQWEYRNGNNYRNANRSYTRYVNTGRQWEQFVTIGNRIVTLSELEKMIGQLRNEARTLQQATRSARASKTDDKTTGLA